MEPVETADTVLFKGDGEEVLDFPARVDAQEGVLRSTWELTDGEREAIAAGGRIELTMAAYPPPPVGLTVVGPEDGQRWSPELGAWSKGVEE